MSDGTLSWLKPFARAGYASRGVVYTIIGLFAVLAAFGMGGKTNSKGALQTVLEQPFGNFLLWIVVVGLLGYVAWRLVQSLLDTDDHGWSPKGIAVRIGLLASAFTYTTLAIYSLSMLGVFSSGSGGSGESNAVAQFIGGIVGMQWVTLALAVIFFGVACAHWWKAYKKKYADHLTPQANEIPFVHTISRTGLTARGIVFAVISLILFVRWQTYEGGNGTPGIEDAMSYVQDLPMGQWLLAALGIGIVLFALYSFTEARYRRINVEDAQSPA